MLLFVLCWLLFIAYALIRNGTSLSSPYYGTWQIKSEPLALHSNSRDLEVLPKSIAGQTWTFSPWYTQVVESDGHTERIHILPKYEEKMIRRDLFLKNIKSMGHSSPDIKEEVFLVVIVRKDRRYQMSFGYSASENQLLIRDAGIWHRGVRVK